MVPLPSSLYISLFFCLSFLKSDHCQMTPIRRGLFFGFLSFLKEILRCPRQLDAPCQRRKRNMNIKRNTMGAKRESPNKRDFLSRNKKPRTCQRKEKRKERGGGKNIRKRESFPHVTSSLFFTREPPHHQRQHHHHHAPECAVALHGLPCLVGRRAAARIQHRPLHHPE